MKAYSLRLAALSAVPLFGACAADGQGPSGPQVKIEAAALVLGNVTEINYGLTVFNGDPVLVNGVKTSAVDTVWTKANLSTVDYGNAGGGDLTYIGPCDASVESNNYVALVIEDIDTSTGPLDDQNTSTDGDPDFVNPCPSNDPCVLDFECVENADVAVEFNITVMRDANQGFFDIAVNFEDVFCSGKFDSCYDVSEASYTTSIGQENGKDVTCYEFKDAAGNILYAAFTGVGKGWALWESCLSGLLSSTSSGGFANTIPGEIRYGESVYKPVMTGGTGTPIVLLHNQTTGKREHTGIAALACTAGADTATKDISTELIFTRPVVACANGVKFSLDLEGADGGKQSQADDNGLGKTIEYGLYFGNETLDCGQGPGSCNKVYYNIAINLDLLAAQGLSNCRLKYAASAIEAGDESTFDEFGALIDPNAVYGAVSFGVQSGLPLTGPVREGQTPEPSCVAMPLGGATSAVTPVYVKGSGYGDQQSGVLDYFTTGGPAEAFSQPQ